MNGRVLLLQLSERTSAKGNRYLSGWLGKASAIAFQAEEPDRFGNPVWDVFVSTPEPRTDQRPLPLERPAPPAGVSGGSAFHLSVRPRLSRLCHRLHVTTAGAAQPTAGPRTAPSGLLRPTTGPWSMTASKTWGDADAGHAEGRSGLRRRSWRRKALFLQRAAIGFYVATIVLVGLAFVWPWSVLFALAAGVAGVWCQRAVHAQSRH